MGRSHYTAADVKNGSVWISPSYLQAFVLFIGDRETMGDRVGTCEST